jgi:hypothetical protein
VTWADEQLRIVAKINRRAWPVALLDVFQNCHYRPRSFSAGLPDFLHLNFRDYARGDYRMVMPFIEPDPTCACESCEAGRAQLGQPTVATESQNAHSGPFEQRRAVPTKMPLNPGQLDPDASADPVDVPSMSHEERVERVWRLTRQGGAEGSQERLNVLRDKPDHPLGDTAEARV